MSSRIVKYYGSKAVGSSIKILCKTQCVGWSGYAPPHLPSPFGEGIKNLVGTHCLSHPTCLSVYSKRPIFFFPSPPWGEGVRRTGEGLIKKVAFRVVIANLPILLFAPHPNPPHSGREKCTFPSPMGEGLRVRAD